MARKALMDKRQMAQQAQQPFCVGGWVEVLQSAPPMLSSWRGQRGEIKAVFPQHHQPYVVSVLFEGALRAKLISVGFVRVVEE